MDSSAFLVPATYINIAEAQRRKKGRRQERRNGRWKGEGGRRIIHSNNKKDEMGGRETRRDTRKYERWPVYRREKKFGQIKTTRAA